MRPAQKAPENFVLLGEGTLKVNNASMRPAQKAPENTTRRVRASAGARCFNEAGAKSAGKRLSWASVREVERFTSMRPAQKAPENPTIKRITTRHSYWLQ